MVVKHISLDHLGGFYFYRIHNAKLNKLGDGFSQLKDYLEDVFKNCPHDYFNSGPRSSALRFKLPLETKRVKGHEVCSLARCGLKINNDRYYNNHSKVQVFMLENDNKTIAVEVPIWLMSNELKNYKNIFKTKEVLSGHVDILRVEDYKIWVWDYKPNADREDYAITQVNFYALMLSKRTGIKLSNFRCGYFDDKNAFVFKPVENIKIEDNSDILSFLQKGL